MRYAAALMVSGAIAISPASAGLDVIRITGDSGGQIGIYLKKFQAWRKAGKRVVVDGPCLSACTIVLGVLPRARVCVTSRARFDFHAPWRPDSIGRPEVNADATRFLMDIYPGDVRAWLADQATKGGCRLR